MTISDALDSIIGYMGAIGTVGLIIWGAAEMGVEQGRKQAYREFICPREAVYVTVRWDLLETKCVLPWRKP